MKTESVNPFDQTQQPEQFARYEKIVAAVQAGKTDKELWAEFKVGPKSCAEIRENLGEGKKEPGDTSPPAPLPIAPQRGEGGDETAPGEGTRPTTTEA